MKASATALDQPFSVLFGRLPVGLGSSNKIPCHTSHLSLLIWVFVCAASTGLRHDLVFAHVDHVRFFRGLCQHKCVTQSAPRSGEVLCCTRLHRRCRARLLSGGQNARRGHGDLQKSAVISAKDSTLEHSLFAAFNTVVMTAPSAPCWWVGKEAMSPGMCACRDTDPACPQGYPLLPACYPL